MADLWWVWIAAALVLAGLETVVSGYIFLGFAAGALVTGGTLWAGGPLAAWLAGSLALCALFFALASLLAWLAMRRIFGLRGGSVKTFDRDINDG